MEAWVTRRVSLSASNVITAPSDTSMTLARRRPQRGEARQELTSLAEEEVHHLLVHLRAKRLEEDADDEGGEHGVEDEEGLPFFDPRREDEEDGGQHDGQHRLARHLAQQLMQVHQPQPEKGLGEKEEVERRHHRTQGGEGDAEHRKQVEPRKEEGRRRADGQVGQSRALGAGVALADAVHQDGNRAQKRRRPPQHDEPVAPPRAGERTHRHAEPDDAAQDGHAPAPPPPGASPLRNSRKKPSAALGTRMPARSFAPRLMRSGQPRSPLLRHTDSRKVKR